MQALVPVTLNNGERAVRNEGADTPNELKDKHCNATVVVPQTVAYLEPNYCAALSICDIPKNAGLKTATETALKAQPGNPHPSSFSLRLLETLHLDCMQLS